MENMTEKEKIAEITDRCIVDLLGSAGRVNEYRTKKDFGRNHTNYGYASKSANVLRSLGKNVDIACYWDSEEYLVVPHVKIDGKITKFNTSAE